MNLNILKRIVFFEILVFCNVLAFGCSTQNQVSETNYDSTINNTINKSIVAINQNDAPLLISYFGHAYPEDLISLKMIQPKVTRFYYLISKYHDNDLKSLEWTTDSSIDQLGRMKYVIPIFKGFDSLTGIKSAQLNLFVGPPEIIPFDSLSGVEFEIQVDADYRGELLNQGKLLETEDLLRYLER